MLYTVAEAADFTNLSKVSIYNKLKLKELEPYITKNKGVTYISEDGVNLIKSSLNLKNDNLKDLNHNDMDTALNDGIEPREEDLNVKDDYINYLKAENEKLWQEIQEKNNQITNFSRLVQNGQVLLKDKNDNDNILELEAHFTELDNKLIKIREQMEERRISQEKKGFWGKIFKR